MIREESPGVQFRTDGVWFVTPMLRFVNRDGRRILQQMWATNVGSNKWEDVPEVDEDGSN